MNENPNIQYQHKVPVYSARNISLVTFRKKFNKLTQNFEKPLNYQPKEEIFKQQFAEVNPMRYCSSDAAYWFYRNTLQKKKQTQR